MSAELPAEVEIREVGPRDGFQNEPEVIPTAEKVRLIDLLTSSGVRRVEVTSFVRADVIPQLSDASEVLAGIERRDGVSLSVLIPNQRGLQRALEMRERFDEISVFLSASETHNRRNVNRSIEESLAGSPRGAGDGTRGGAALRGGDRDLVRLPLRGPRAAGAGPGDRRRAGRGGLPRRSVSATPPGWRTRARCASSTPAPASGFHGPS